MRNLGRGRVDAAYIIIGVKYVGKDGTLYCAHGYYGSWAKAELYEFCGSGLKRCTIYEGAGLGALIDAVQKKFAAKQDGGYWLNEALSITPTTWGLRRYGQRWQSCQGSGSDGRRDTTKIKEKDAK